MKEKEYWKYKTNDEDKQSYVVINKIDGDTAHISVYNVNVNGKMFDIGHIPINIKILQNSLKEKIDNIATKKDDIFIEGYQYWIKNKGGVWDKPLNEVIRYIKNMLKEH